MKVHNEEGALLDPNDFGDGGYISAGLERGADYVFATKDGFSVPAEFSARFVMPGQDLEAEKQACLQANSIDRIWDLKRGVTLYPGETLPEPETYYALSFV